MLSVGMARERKTTVAVKQQIEPKGSNLQMVGCTSINMEH